MAGLEGRVLRSRYRVDEYVGGGGMADVYKAWDLERACHLAIKLMRQSLGEFEELGERFKREADVLSRLQHPNIVHPDIKPSNLNAARDGRAVLSDFGIARLSDALTMTYQGIGTPAYMSPEQCAGEEPGALSDIYSLGVVVYECLTGRRPFIGDMGRGDPPTTANVLKEHLELPTPMPSEVNPSLSAAVEAVILRA